MLQAFRLWLNTVFWPLNTARKPFVPEDQVIIIPPSFAALFPPSQNAVSLHASIAFTKMRSQYCIRYLLPIKSRSTNYLEICKSRPHRSAWITAYRVLPCSHLSQPLDTATQDRDTTTTYHQISLQAGFRRGKTHPRLNSICKIGGKTISAPRAQCIKIIPASCTFPSRNIIALSRCLQYSINLQYLHLVPEKA